MMRCIVSLNNSKEPTMQRRHWSLSYNPSPSTIPHNQTYMPLGNPLDRLCTMEPTTPANNSSIIGYSIGLLTLVSLMLFVWIMQEWVFGVHMQLQGFVGALQMSVLPVGCIPARCGW
ncbi:hypothetical protein M426DRAFT_78149 [Hypoxylon sp. CI-4A]|nr:hypothetical protein M426DRAFT_78149 [Hypoxylon sp. CI-4A]